MKKFLTLTILAGAMMVPMAHAQSLIEPSYTHHKPRVSFPWYVAGDAASRQADLDFITGMRPHHAGALSMSKDYLANPDASNTMMMQLARGIIHNQEFEIAMLDRVERHVKAADDSDGNGNGLTRVADKGLSQEQMFYRAPMPGLFDAWAGDDTTSAADVKFAKAMIVHHEGALVMCQSYLDNPSSNNGYLERMCLDILRDQAQEIAFMHAQKNKYPGDVDAVSFDPSMVHGMDDMMDHMGHH